MHDRQLQGNKGMTATPTAVVVWPCLPLLLAGRWPPGRAGRPQARAPAGAGWQEVGGRGQVGLREKWLYFSYTLLAPPAGGARPSIPHRPPPHCAHGYYVPPRAPRSQAEHGAET
jgi:hypothetical protein